jgi:hypothetical protein
MQTSDDHVATLVTESATSATGVLAMATVLKSQRMIEHWEAHQEIAVSLADDLDVMDGCAGRPAKGRR